VTGTPPKVAEDVGRVINTIRTCETPSPAEECAFCCLWKEPLAHMIVMGWVMEIERE